MATKLRIGYVPEHFSTPLHFAQKYFNLNASLIPFPSGTGHMIQSLKSSEIDVGVGLTEGWVAGLAAGGQKPAYSLVGTYVKTPLCWAISTGAQSQIRSAQELHGKKIGVSRIGSGSYVMGFVLADQYGWLKKDREPPFEVVPLSTFKNLRDGVNAGTADFFMWEHFTSKRYYDNHEIKRIGEIFTPWSSWKIVAQNPTDERLEPMLESINQGVAYFEKNHGEAIDFISTELDYSVEDAASWLKTVEFANNVKGVDPEVIDKTIDILGKAGVIDGTMPSSLDMIAIEREEN